MSTKETKAREALLSSLFIEVCQAEQSAETHPRREAKRLGESAPAAAMLAVSRHGASSRPRFQQLAKARGFGKQTMGAVIGHLLSDVRTFGTDLLLAPEKTYRGTLMGIQHGVDAVLLLEDAAIARDDAELADFCAQWITERRQLVSAAEDALAWFAQNPDIALGWSRA